MTHGLDHNHAEAILLTLQTRNGPIKANIFVTENERSIGIVLYRNGKAVAAESFDAPTVRRLKTDCLRWLASRRLDNASRLALITELEENYSTLRSIRHNGEDITQSWLGSRASRRISDVLDDAII